MAIETFLSASLGTQRRELGIGGRAKGANLGSTENSGRPEEGERPTDWCHRGARRIGLATDSKGEGRRSFPAGRSEKEEACRHHPGGKKAVVAGNEEALGRAQKEGFVADLFKSSADSVPVQS